jgi:hypothetical protein
MRCALLALRRRYLLPPSSPLVSGALGPTPRLLTRPHAGLCTLSPTPRFLPASLPGLFAGVVGLASATFMMYFPTLCHEFLGGEAP